MIQYNTIQCNTMQCNAMQCNAMEESKARWSLMYYEIEFWIDWCCDRFYVSWLKGIKCLYKMWLCICSKDTQTTEVTMRIANIKHCSISHGKLQEKIPISKISFKQNIMVHLIIIAKPKYKVKQVKYSVM